MDDDDHSSGDSDANAEHEDMSHEGEQESPQANDEHEDRGRKVGGELLEKN